ncbi:MAG TPA: DUF4129 domain-containing protein [Ignisphaera aggregans]|uniref:DUF4129 domain-containing protein n=1 Tax=Ignisphaera aggregans TaxID=334771 RepID=A0A832Z2S6_9CREN|nr:DUF4129 domain-containing protein [Ignisphaera aggregans]
MKLIPISTLLILVLLSVSSISTHLYAESWPRHTPGFPEIEGVDVEGLELLADLLKRLESFDTLTQVQKDPELRWSIARSIEMLSKTGVLDREEATVIRKIVANKTSLNELIDMVKDVRVRALLTRLINYYDEYGYVPHDHLSFVVNVIRSMYGKLDPEDYLLALEVLKRFANVIGAHELATSLDREAFKALKDVLATSYSRRLSLSFPQIPNIVPDISVLRPEIPVASPGLALNIPAITFPELALSYIPLPLLLLLLFIAIPIALYIAIPRISSSVRRVLRGLRTFSTLRREGLAIASERMPRVVELYWRAVERVSGVTGVVKSDVVTHREYLEAVKDRLGSSYTHFEEVTRGYEAVRFGGVDESEVIERVERAYRELVRSL